MTAEEAPKTQENGIAPTLTGRLSALEAALQLDRRIDAVEALVIEKRSSLRPWWRDAKTVTVLGALLASVLPVLTWINNAYTSARESRRLIVEQQEKIRQTYLDRVLRPGISEVEQQRVFGLLSRLSSDPELQKWAQDELKRTTETIANLKKEKEQLQSNLFASESRLVSLNKKVEGLTNEEKKQRADDARQTASLRDRIETLDRQLGSMQIARDTINTLDGSTGFEPTAADIRADIRKKYEGLKRTIEQYCDFKGRIPSQVEGGDCGAARITIGKTISEMEQQFPWLLKPQ